jgi:hypothetical protein
MKKSIIVLLILLSCLLGCVSNQNKPDTQSGNIEISRDDCIKKARNSDPEHPNKQCSLDLTALVNMFSSSGVVNWDIGAEIDTPIIWKTKGRSLPINGLLRCDGGLLECDGSIGSPERCGEVFVTMNNRITHTVLEKTIQPGCWDISLSGSNVGVSEVQLYVSTSINSNLDDIIDYLRNHGINLNLLSKDNRFYANKKELYEIKTANDSAGWLKNEQSCGVSGAVCSYTLTIFYDRDSAIKSME